jgi:Nucleotidyl transferase AbiEii toxin, Type IV TA system
LFNLDWMPQRTQTVFTALSKHSMMSGLILIGGTALSIQLGHRLSEDLDFWLPGDYLDKHRIDRLLSDLAAQGLSNKLVTPAWKITQAKINGQDLLAQSRDHVIGGVKVTFFARNDIPYQHFSGLLKHHQNGISFDWMDKLSIFKMKSWLISQRVRSRDLFDLMIFVRDQGLSVRDIFVAGASADPSFQPEYAKEVLLGHLPLDQDDEGFNSIGLDMHIQSIYQFFSQRIDDYEVALATTIAQSFKQQS